MGRKSRKKQLGIPKKEQSAAGGETSFTFVPDNFCPLHVKYADGHLSCTVRVEKANPIDVGTVMQSMCNQWNVDPDQCQAELLPSRARMPAERLTAENNGQPPVLFIQPSRDASISVKLAEEKAKVLAFEEGTNAIDRPKDLSKDFDELRIIVSGLQEKISQQGEKISQQGEKISQQGEKISDLEKENLEKGKKISDLEKGNSGLQEENFSIHQKLNKIDFYLFWGDVINLSLFGLVGESLPTIIGLKKSHQDEFDKLDKKVAARLNLSLKDIVNLDAVRKKRNCIAHSFQKGNQSLPAENDHSTYVSTEQNERLVALSKFLNQVIRIRDFFRSFLSKFVHMSYSDLEQNFNSKTEIFQKVEANLVQINSQLTVKNIVDAGRYYNCHEIAHVLPEECKQLTRDQLKNDIKYLNNDYDDGQYRVLQVMIDCYYL